MNKKSEIAKLEEKTLDFWQKNKIFEKTLEKKAPKGEFVFYDGPPFATGLPHYGHLLAGTIKDVIPRYKTMRGYRVPRRWGWDCHGLPLENIVEKELEFETKEDIKKFGIDKFNNEARKRVLRYRDDWMRIVPRTGRWVDMENDYRTMDTSYTESVWWVFKSLYDKGLVYEGFKSMHLCPRCGTTLSNFEVTQGYKEIKDIAVTVKLELEDEPGTHILVWTTTPWTLPGNSAAALNPELEYVKVQVGKDKYILAKSRIEETLDGLNYEILGKVNPKEILGRKYKPPFDYYVDEDIENKENAWKIYEADYVDDEEGTGFVHLAPAFGEEDMEMAKVKNIPLIQHVDEEGKFKSEVKDFAGLYVKPRDEEGETEKHLETDIKIVVALKEKNLLVKKENIKHSYPHCWRCETPLLNYAASSWFIEVTKIKNKLIEANKKIGWVPPEIGSNRFGDWLENAKDWAISRDRYWGAPIPVWKNEETGEIKVIGSIDDIKEVSKSQNEYFLMRHGEAESNVNGVISTNIETKNPLTEKGQKEVEKTAGKLKKQDIDFIYASDFERTKETTEILAKELGISKDRIIFDERIREYNAGVLDGKDWEEYHTMFGSIEERFTKAPEGGETYNDLRRRIGDFLYEIDTRHKKQNILIVSHGLPLFVARMVVDGLEEKDYENSHLEHFKTGEAREFEFFKLSHDDDYELDLHLPHIDRVEFRDDKGNVFKRIPQVFDCWFESGSMPYGQNHHPFENTDKFEPKEGKGYPADFIAEGLDQTRGWFYSMIVLSVALFDEASYKNVIVNGLVLAEDGKKMAKSLQNFPDPMHIIDKYGADAMRYYMISSPVVRAQDLSFSEKGVDEVVKKVVLKILNIHSFVEMYTKKSQKSEIKDQKYLAEKSKNVLDKWILSKLQTLRDEITENMDDYKLDKASRPILDFVDEFSVWYLRRSRNRFKTEDEDAKYAIATTQYVLLEISKLIAPFMPFLAEDLYQKIGGKKESVHLEDWPVYGKRILGLFKVGGYRDLKLEEEMTKARKAVREGLEERAKAQIKIRQPVTRISSTVSRPTAFGLHEIIVDELNVKDIKYDRSDTDIDTTITRELEKEGQTRDLTRAVQGLRKKENLLPEDKVQLIMPKEHEDLVRGLDIHYVQGATNTTVVFKDEVRGEGKIKIKDTEIDFDLEK